MVGREWLIWDYETAAARPEVGDAVARFESVPTEAGEAGHMAPRERAGQRRIHADAAVSR